MIKKEHLSNTGLLHIVGIKASLNKGLSGELKLAFPNMIPVHRPIVEFKGIPDMNWLAGFTTGDGCFLINIIKSSSYKSGAQVILRFLITQHSRDQKLMKSLDEYFDCGNYHLHYNRDSGNYVVTGLSDIVEKIIPFFKKYKIVGVKALDFANFCKVAELMKNKDHLNQIGLEQIHKIKAGMNTGRES
jgi:hypothetical protein